MVPSSDTTRVRGYHPLLEFAAGTRDLLHGRCAAAAPTPPAARSSPKAGHRAIQQLPADFRTPIPYWLKDGADVAEIRYRSFGRRV